MGGTRAPNSCCCGLATEQQCRASGSTSEPRRARHAPKPPKRYGPSAAAAGAAITATANAATNAPPSAAAAAFTARVRRFGRPNAAYSPSSSRCTVLSLVSTAVCASRCVQQWPLWRTHQQQATGVVISSGGERGPLWSKRSATAAAREWVRPFW